LPEKRVIGQSFFLLLKRNKEKRTTAMKKLKLIALIGILAVALGAVTAQADLITNGSFETGSDLGAYVSLVAADTTTIPGWSVTANNGHYVGSMWTASDGVRSVHIPSGYFGVVAPAAITTSFATTSGAQYKITFDLAGNFWAYAPGPMRIAVSAAGTTRTYDSLRPSDWYFDKMGWTQETFLFTANNDTTTLEFKAVFVPEACNAYGNLYYFAGHGPALDNVQGSMVPLPPSALLLGSGLLGLAGWRRFRKS
jgi:hypothetical protein